MNIVEKEALEFYKYDFLNSSENLEGLKSALNSKLYSFNRDRDKLDFLKIIRDTCSIELENHKKNCNGCDYDRQRNKAIFVVEQEIESVNKYYSFEPKKEEEFTTEEESKLHSKLNKILNDLEKQNFGQQIIFEEIEELKNHFNLGKKTWFQLAKGKLFELTVDKVIDKVVCIEIFDTLSDGFEHVNKILIK
ncbi:hypothetical protein RYR30_002472 [Flavobacterium psychrophilum]|jgi:hypothetical protein|uniref:hypothetical protein n=1 Tax=Flavobacterium psychrophilum TaxID=96345 RepID=UPI001C8F9360|nr:hypothetical protein [Flavobacterium psychrophilum]ELM3651472.1 hypothetical protein [Flavobacterium psychrophilum]ELM3672495.1 hypothetical protein [Flavobacterium psychrophilum]ELM3727014.1 hypothetical protein [Flavobacterium psychrophilum]QZK98804.1 hypothetical protein K5L05_03705 [Flavobacterium psychrophilum]